LKLKFNHLWAWKRRKIFILFGIEFYQYPIKNSPLKFFRLTFCIFNLNFIFNWQIGKIKREEKNEKR